MRSHKFGAGALALLLASAGLGVADRQSGKPRFGKPISEAEIAAWNIDVRTPDGKNLPSGKGSVAEGKALFAAQCAACQAMTPRADRCTARWSAASDRSPPIPVC